MAATVLSKFNIIRALNCLVEKLFEDFNDDKNEFYDEIVWII
jgi:hypothetical protein